MVDTGFTTPAGRIVVAGEPGFVVEKNVETVANVYPGRLLKRGTTDYDVAVNDAVAPVVGIAGYEHTRAEFMKEAKATIYTVGDDIAVLRGSNFVCELKCAAGFYAYEGDLMVPWGAGMVAPAGYLAGLLCVRIPYTKNAAEVDTSVDVPTGVIIGVPIVQSVVADASGTIDIGMGFGTEGGFDADGLVDGLALAATGFPAHNQVDATNTATNLGDLLDEVQIKDATGTPVYMNIPIYPGLACDGTLVSISYTTSNHTQSGHMWIPVFSPAIRPIGIAQESVDASAAAAAIKVLITGV
jgi:hypothetical protein